MYKGKNVVWITGASSGIGEAMSMVYSEKGYYVILSARSIHKLELVQASLNTPSDSFIQFIDMANSASISDAWNSISNKNIVVDLLINNAGISQRSKVLETNLAAYRKLMEVNYHGVVDLSKKVVQNMVDRQKGHIAVISSIAGKVGAPRRSGYSASKHALHGFFDCLRAEVTDHNVAVSIICPGYAKTNVDVNALDGRGEASGKKDNENQSGMDPDKLALKIYRALESKKKEVYFGGFEVLAVYLKRFWPALLSHILVKKNRSN